MVIKGILHPDDARQAREQGMDGVIVSNHGGRQLDGSIPPLHALPAVVDAARAHRRDARQRRAARLRNARRPWRWSARCVFVGRPFNYAAAAVAGTSAEWTAPLR